MRIYIADNFEQSGLSALAALNCEVTYQPKLKDEALLTALRTHRPDVLVVRSTKVTEAMLDAAPLKLVVRAGAGYNTIDVPAASQRGIYVSNCPGKNAIAVAELAFALILALDRRIPDNVVALRGGHWNKTEFSKSKGLFGRTLGLIGLGPIAREMIPRARAFGMKIIAHGRSLTDQSADALGIHRRDSIIDVAREADIVSVHLALTKETRSLLAADFFSAMKDGACFINTARAELVDEAALLNAIHQKHLRVGVDVYQDEPTAGSADFTSPLSTEPTVYTTHHIGASTEQAQEAIASETVRIIKSFFETGQVPNAVNLATRTPATCILAVRHRDRPGVLATVLDAISAAHINVQEMENIVFEGAQAAVARIHLESTPPPQVLQDLTKANENILEMSVIPLG